MAFNAYCAQEFCIWIKRANGDVLTLLCDFCSLSWKIQRQGSQIIWNYLQVLRLRLPVNLGPHVLSMWFSLCCLFIGLVWTFSHHLSSKGVFLMHRLGLWVLGKKTTEVKDHSYHIMSMVHVLNMTTLMMLVLTSWLK